ncbi:MAG: flagellar hook-basal body complex protein FliE [Oleibacter sp.]|nr:flagellar hook-basal body complex protein FliE [Thalassolituus sp.]
MVDRVDVSSVLSQMREVRSQLRSQNEMALQAQGGIDKSAPDAMTRISNEAKRLSEISSSEMKSDNSIPDFQSMFKNAIDKVNDNQKVAGNLATRFEQGDASVDLPEVMIALQKSSVSFQAMTQVRNKLVEAYKDVMNMPV